MDVDLSEVRQFLAALEAVDGRLSPVARATVKKSMQDIKTDTRQRVSGHPSWRKLAPTINYNMVGNKYFAEGEVGYDDVGQGELAGIYEFGSARRAPHPTLIPASEAETPRFMKFIDDAMQEIEP